MATLLYKQEVFEVIGAAMEVHKTLGRGFTEYVYQDAMAVELQERGIPFEKEKQLTVTYKGVQLAHDYFADFVTHGKVILELKAVKELADEHRAQLLNYLKATGLRVGVLINFGANSLEYERYIN